ncbi:MAG: ECF-type sigma factor [Planctomycetota bacterium]
MKSAPDITSILNRISSGESGAVDELLPLVYSDLHLQASKRMANERSDHTLQATALVHDAYMRLLGSRSKPNFASQRHFFAAAAKAMQRILVDHARARSRKKRGGDRIRIELSDVGDHREKAIFGPDQMLELDDALHKLETIDPPVAELVRLRLYTGLSVTEAAGVLGVSRTVAYEQWDYALSWFAVEVGDA